MITPSIKKLHLELSTTRIEALTDGVFAIAMTILVLNLDLRGELTDFDQFKNGLLKIWPSFLHYVESFIIIASFWVKHHQQFHFIKRSDRNLLWINILGLLFICLIPFSTSLVGDYGDLRVATIIFEANMLFAGLIYGYQWFYATKNHRLVEKDLDAYVIASYKRFSLIVPVISLAAIALSIIHPRWGTSLFLLIPFALIYLK